MRAALVAAGLLLTVFGAFRLVTQVPLADLIVLAVWLVGAVAIHDGVLAPVVVGVGWTIGRVVPPRARRYLQAFLIAGALVTVLAVPLIERQGSQPPARALLEQDYGGHLALLLGVLAGVSLLGYCAQVAHGRHERRADDPS